MAHQKIRYALLERLINMADVPTVVTENVPFTPSQGQIYIKESYLPAETTTVGTSGTSSDEYRGIYQVSIYLPMDIGSDAGYKLASDIRARFSKGLHLTRLGQIVQVQQVSIAAAVPMESRWMIPVSINWRAFSG
jgi:hypothetical protein